MLLYHLSAGVEWFDLLSLMMGKSIAVDSYGQHALKTNVLILEDLFIFRIYCIFNAYVNRLAVHDHVCRLKKKTLLNQPKHGT